MRVSFFISCYPRPSERGESEKNKKGKKDRNTGTRTALRANHGDRSNGLTDARVFCIERIYKSLISLLSRKIPPRGCETRSRRGGTDTRNVAAAKNDQQRRGSGSECVQVEGRKRTREPRGNQVEEKQEDKKNKKKNENKKREKMDGEEEGRNDEKWWGSEGERGGGRYSDK